MNLYEKFKSIEHPQVNPFAELLGVDYDDRVEVRITPNTIMNKVIGYAMRKLRSPDTKWIILIGQDSAVTLTEKCARILQRNFKGLHQCNSSNFKIHEDIWTPKDTSSDLDSLSVRRHTPAVWIFLAKAELPEKLKHHPQRVEIKPLIQKKQKRLS